MELDTIHYPNLRTILMVEDTLKSADFPPTREQLKKMLPKQVMHQTLNVIISYLEESGKVYDGRKGIVWTQNPNLPIHEGMEFSSFLAQERKRSIANPPKKSSEP